MNIRNYLVILAGITVSTSCFAQCAPGIPSAGNPGCIPPTAPGSPYALPDGSVPPPIPAQQQRARWADSWGAIAVDTALGKAGDAEDQSSKQAANQVAMDYCRQNGGNACKVAISYYNQCVSVAQPSSGKGDIFYSTSAEQADADRRALQNCGTDCITVIRKCSLPKRID